MTVQTFRELLRQRPFRPFRVVMSGGVSYEVHQPEAAFLTQSDLLVGLDMADDGVPEDFEICPLTQVAAVEPLGRLPAEPRPAGTA